MYPRGLHVSGTAEGQKPINYCLACEKYFSSSAGHREHMRSDWHSYNLKRKIANLQPISEEHFRLITESDSVINESDSSKFECNRCNKIYRTSNALDNHFNSKRHRFKEGDVPVQKCESPSKNGTPQKKNWHLLLLKCKTSEEVEDLIAEKEASYQPPPDSLCLFCDLESEDLEKNENHMRLEHGFIIPLSKYLVDKHGLILHLATKIGKYNLCIYCDGRGKTFYDPESVRKHMKALKHYCLNLQTLRKREYKPFYNFPDIPNYRYVLWGLNTPDHIEQRHLNYKGGRTITTSNIPADKHIHSNGNCREDSYSDSGSIHSPTVEISSDKDVHTDYSDYSTNYVADDLQSVSSSRSEIILVSQSLDKFMLHNGEVAYSNIPKRLPSRRKNVNGVSNSASKHSDVTKGSYKPYSALSKKSSHMPSHPVTMSRRSLRLYLNSHALARSAALEERMTIDVKSRNMQKHFRSQIGFGA